MVLANYAEGGFFLSRVSRRGFVRAVKDSRSSGELKLAPILSALRRGSSNVRKWDFAGLRNCGESESAREPLLLK